MSADALVAEEQRELLVIAKALAGRLAEADRQALGRCGPLSADLRSDLWMLEEEKQRVPDHLFRLALSVAEAALSISTILSSRRLAEGRAVLRDRSILFQWTVDGKRESKEVESSYFSSRLANRADLPRPLADVVWTAIVVVALDGRVGLPGLRLERHHDERPCLVLADGMRMPDKNKPYVPCPFGFPAWIGVKRRLAKKIICGMLPRYILFHGWRVGALVRTCTGLNAVILDVEPVYIYTRRGKVLYDLQFSTTAGGCSLRHCGVDLPLTYEEAVAERDRIIRAWRDNDVYGFAAKYAGYTINPDGTFDDKADEE